MGAAALPLFTEPDRALASLEAGAQHAELPAAPVGMSAANKRAAQLASDSPYVRATFARSFALAETIGDRHLRGSALNALSNAQPLYMRKYPTVESRTELRDALARANLVAADANVSGIFPLLSDIGEAQPFWSAPGSDGNGHHAYPGGLVTHELFNARCADELSRSYDTQYFDSARAVDRDMVITAAFYHDLMKTVVFQYNDAGTLFDELTIAGTGAHHVLSGAEAIVRGESPRLVAILLSAHAAPSLGDEAKVVAWCRAAAMIAGVDPVHYGLLRPSDGSYALAFRPPIECFVSHLSDHDYVLSIHAAREVSQMLAQIAPQFGKSANAETLNWWRLRIRCQIPDITLYHELAKSEDAFVAAVKRLS